MQARMEQSLTWMLLALQSMTSGETSFSLASFGYCFKSSGQAQVKAVDRSHSYAGEVWPLKSLLLRNSPSDPHVTLMHDARS